MKGAVEIFTKYVAKEYGTRGIRANIVAPGPIETDFNQAVIRNNPQMKIILGNQAALERLGQADDIGSIVAFLVPMKQNELMDKESKFRVEYFISLNPLKNYFN